MNIYSEGLTQKRIINLSQFNILNDSIECKTCHKIAFPPCTCNKCSITFCYHCLKNRELICVKCGNHLDFFPQFLKNIYHDFEVKCPNDECTETMKIIKLQDHQNVCMHNFDIVNIKGCSNKKQLNKKEESFEIIPQIDNDFTVVELTNEQRDQTIKNLEGRVGYLENVCKKLIDEIHQLKPNQIQSASLGQSKSYANKDL